MMGQASILKQGSSFNNMNYTAIAADVKTGKKFLGKGSQKLQTGTKPVISKVDQKLNVNGTYNIAAGYHQGQDRIYQEIPTQGAIQVTPTVNSQTINIAGKVMSGNVTINAAENFQSQYIKKGVTVGEGSQAITGTFEGFV